MFECVLLNVPGIRVLHEPAGDAAYFGPEHTFPRYSAEECANNFSQYKDSTYEKVWHDIVNLEAGEKAQRTFSKDMAQYLFCPSNASHKVTSVASLPKNEDDDKRDLTNPTLIPAALLLDPSVQHTFLIRTPAKAVPSYHRLCFPGSETGFEYWDPEEAGVHELRQLFDFVKDQTGETPIVVESEHLLKEPAKVMGDWCKAVDIDFNEDMLEWNEGTREHFAKWPGFHTTAEQSKGINKGVREEHKTPCNYDSPKKNRANGGGGDSTPAERNDLPEEVQQCILANMDDYHYLASFTKAP